MEIEQFSCEYEFFVINAMRKDPNTCIDQSRSDLRHTQSIVCLERLGSRALLALSERGFLEMPGSTRN